MYCNLLLKLISYIINIILQTETCTRVPKRSTVISVYKTGDEQSDDNYPCVDEHY